MSAKSAPRNSAISFERRVRGDKDEAAMFRPLAAGRVIDRGREDAHKSAKPMERRIAAALAEEELGIAPAFVMG